jgi:hypothetical protein
VSADDFVFGGEIDIMIYILILIFFFWGKFVFHESFFRAFGPLCLTTTGPSALVVTILHPNFSGCAAEISGFSQPLSRYL